MPGCESLTNDDVVTLLKARVAQYDTNVAAAKALGVSSPYLTDVLKGRREIGPTLASALGLQKTVVFTSADCG